MDEKQKALEHTLDALAVAGWVESWGHNAATDDLVVVWTDLGRERARWLRTITAELDPGGGMWVWLEAVSHMFPPDVAED